MKVLFHVSFEKIIQEYDLKSNGNADIHSEPCCPRVVCGDNLSHYELKGQASEGCWRQHQRCLFKLPMQISMAIETEVGKMQNKQTKNVLFNYK